MSSEPRPRPGLSRARARPPVPRRSRARSTGLDIGTFAVRAAEVTMLRGRPVVTRFGQVTLPPGAVRAGEVVDPEAVIAAIHRLWAEGGFRGRRVVIGVANSRVVVRQADLPAMGEADLRSALRFEAAELIPLPVEESQLDFQVLESVDNGAGEPRVRLLLAAGQRDMIDLAVTTAGAARLSPSAVDVVPLSLVRALGSAGGEEPGRTAEAIVAVGAGVTNVVVHDGGVPCYVRILGAGADSITDALVAQLALPVDAAEDLKRRIGSPGGPALPPAGAAAGAVVA
ncbi:MAG: type IV pilus assembly protein PilM, partial [Acidimicrobiales bacterium]